jgi:hypothetical protein
MMAVNSTSWKRLPVADRDQAFNADEAIKRLLEWSKGSAERFSSMFLWHNTEAPPTDKNSYRLPVADVLDGRPHLIPHAVFTAAAILSGAHGGLVGVVGEEEKLRLKGVVTDIYAKLMTQFGDSRIKPPWMRGGNKEENVTAAVNSNSWDDMLVASAEQQWDGTQAKARLWDKAGGDIRQYRKAFLWWDPAAPEHKNSYRIPLADVIDGELTIVPRVVKAVAAALENYPSSIDVPDEDVETMVSVMASIMTLLEPKLEHQEAPETVVADGAVSVHPPSDWFANPNFQAPTPLTVTADGRVMGHLAAWNTCHASFTNQCVMAPRSATNYKFFLNGSALTADGSQVRVGKITLGTGHADKRYGWIPAADHYDNTGTAVAVVAAGEDRHGIWVAGSLVPGTSEAIAAELRRSPLSGDWRRINGNLELVAALAVNTPGFPIVTLNAAGEPDVLCAAGVVLEDGSVFASEPSAESTVTQEMLRKLGEMEDYVASLNRRSRARRLSVLQGQEGGKDGV